MVELNEKAIEAAEKAWIGDTRLSLYPEQRAALANAIAAYREASSASEEHRRRAAGPSEVKWPMSDPLKKYKDASLPAPDHPDDIAVDRFAAAMKAKLARKRAEGRGGWERKDECTAEFLSKLLRGHVDKGDPLDVGNLAMMLHQRGDRIVSHETGDSETEVPMQEFRYNGEGYSVPAPTDETQGVKREPVAWRGMGPDGVPDVTLHSYIADQWEADGVVVDFLFSLSQLEAVERLNDDLSKALLRWMREAEEERTRAETAEAKLTAALSSEAHNGREGE